MPLSDAEKTVIRRLRSMLRAGAPLSIAKRQTGVYTLKYKGELSSEALAVIEAIHDAHRIQKHLTIESVNQSKQK